MKITVNQLRRIIKEEVEGLLSEDNVLQEMDYATIIKELEAEIKELEAEIKELETMKSRNPEQEEKLEQLLKRLKHYRTLMSPGI